MHRADRAAERLEVLLPTSVTVRGDDRPVRVDAIEIVPGGVLDSSMLTGESESVPIAVGAPAFVGTFIVEGVAEVLVAATGGDTRLAGIAELTASTAKPPTSLARELRRMVRAIALTAIGVGVVSTIGVTVALVPGVLLPTVTPSLAWGAGRMAGRQVLIRNLDAVEKLGSTTFICTDKISTLTRNEMSVVVVWTPAGSATNTGTGYEPTATVNVTTPAAHPAIRRLGAAGVRCPTGWISCDEGRWLARGDPMEAAFDSFARRLGLDVDAIRGADPPTARFAFDQRRRRMSMAYGDSRDTSRTRQISVTVHTWLACSSAMDE